MILIGMITGDMAVKSIARMEIMTMMMVMMIVVVATVVISVNATRREYIKEEYVICLMILHSI